MLIIDINVICSATNSQRFFIQIVAMFIRQRRQQPVILILKSVGYHILLLRGEKNMIFTSM